MSPMRSDEDLERLLRSTLTARGDSVHSGPQWTGQRGDASVRRLRRWQAPLLAAAAAVALAAGVLAIESGGSDHQNRTAHSGPTSPTVTRTSTPPVIRAWTGTACTAPVPAEWTHAASTPLDVGATGPTGALPQAVTDDGSLLVTRDLGRTQDLVLVAPDGSRTTLLSLNRPAGENDLYAYADGNWAVATKDRYASMSGLEPFPTVTEVVLVNLRTRATKTLAKPGDGVIDGATIMNGHVYWDERTSLQAGRGTLADYDIAAQRTSTAWRGELPRAGTGPVYGPAAAPVTLAAGIAFAGSHQAAKVLAVPRSLPTVVAEHTDARTRLYHLSTDGTSYAWTDELGKVLYWWRPGQQAPSRMKLPAAGLAISDDPSFQLAGNWVLASYQPFLVDLRIHAITSAPITGGAGYIEGSGGVLATDIGYGTQTSKPVRIDAATMPDLHC